MAVLKRGLVLGALAIGGILAIAGIASAATKKDGGGDGEPEDMASPEACAAYKQQRTSLNYSCNALAEQQLQLDVQRIEAAANEQWDRVAQLDAARAGVHNQLLECKARVSQLDTLIAGCS